jgi:hypothetical protein
LGKHNKKNPGTSNQAVQTNKCVLGKSPNFGPCAVVRLLRVLAHGLARPLDVVPDMAADLFALGAQQLLVGVDEVGEKPNNQHQENVLPVQRLGVLLGPLPLGSKYILLIFYFINLNFFYKIAFICDFLS